MKIENADIRRKIHYTYRLLYLKDVVLARFLDDPTFSVLNSLIFFHQVDIVNYIQSNSEFLRDLFAIFEDDMDSPKKKEAVLFIKDCCAISKSIQAQNRAQLYHNFIQHGLFSIIVFSLRHRDAALRVAGTDVLVALIDHDPHLVRNHIFAAIKERRKPLTDTLIELLLIEVDLGVKSQMADAIKILLDPNASQPMDAMNRQAGEFAKARAASQMNPQTDAFINSFYDDSADKLFKPLQDLQHRESMAGMTVQEISLHIHLVEVLSFFLRSHSLRSKLFILNERLHERVAQLLLCPQKYMRLTALKWFRTCIGLQDEFHNRQLIQHSLFDPVVDIVYETMPRDNLLNSACLELFEFISREKIGQLMAHLVDKYRERFLGITYVNTFRQLVLKWDHREEEVNGEDSTIATEEMPNRPVNGRRYTGLREDLDEDAYFDGDDPIEADDEDDIALPHNLHITNGVHPVRPLVNYPDDDDETADLLASSPDVLGDKRRLDTDGAEDIIIESSPPEEERGRDRRPTPISGSPGERQSPESFTAKRRRSEEDDELARMGDHAKRRNSSASVGTRMENTNLDDEDSVASNGGHFILKRRDNDMNGAHTLRRMKSMKTKNEEPPDLHAIKSKSPAVQAADEAQDADGAG